MVTMSRIGQEINDRFRRIFIFQRIFILGALIVVVSVDRRSNETICAFP